jgi:hypothetical protein
MASRRRGGGFGSPARVRGASASNSGNANVTPAPCKNDRRDTEWSIIEVL